MAKLIHETVVFTVNIGSCVPVKPLTEAGIQGCMFGLRFFSGLEDQAFISTEGYVFYHLVSPD
jgi:hypothetical protein